MNLLENAAKYTPATERDRRRRSRRPRSSVVVEVADRGPGIPAGANRASSRSSIAVTRPARRGAGLGLAICLGIAQAHGGTLIAENRGRRWSPLPYRPPTARPPPPVPPKLERLLMPRGTGAAVMSGTGPLVLVVEDEPQMRRFLRASLASHGFRLVEAATAREATALATSHSPEVILLDLGLPDGDGIELARDIRGWSRVPIIVISARGREADKVEALDAGADDYLTKPFGVNELLARIRVALRRAGQTSARRRRFSSSALCASIFARREVTLAERHVHLTPIEYRLLALLAQNAGRVLTQRQILEEVWGPNHAGQTHYVRVYMAQLRRKIEIDSARPHFLITEPGVGYRLRDRLD